MTTDTGDILLRAILSDRDDDTARLVYADWLTDNDQQERAEFIRVQVELAAIPDPPPEPSVGMRAASRSQRLAAMHVWSMQWKAKYYALRQRQRELWNYGQPGTWVDSIKPPFDCYQCIDEETISRERRTTDPVLIYRRGFPDRLRCTAADWLRHADAVFWSPKQRIETYDPASDTYRNRRPRPFVVTAQPIERVELTTWAGHPEVLEDHYLEDRWPGIVFTVRQQERYDPTFSLRS